MKFLRSIWDDDDESIACLQQIVGLMLTWELKHQKMVLVVGPKRSGKGTIAEIIRQLVGPMNTASPGLNSLSTQFGMQSLIGKQVAIISDARLTQRTDLAVLAENLLRISGADAVSVPRKFLEDWSGRLTVRFLLLSNEVPRIADPSGALASRFVILTMKNSFFGREDKNLAQRLTAELPSIFAWALDGLDTLEADGALIEPAASREAVQLLEELASPILTFIREECMQEPGASIECSLLFDRWADWCREHHRGDFAGDTQGFGAKLKAAAPWVTVTRPRIDGRQRRH